MEKLKKFALLVFVAMLGGLFSIAATRYFEQKKAFPYDNFPTARAANYEFKTVTTPSFDFAEVSEVAMPTVVHITTTTKPQEGHSQQPSSPFDFFGEDFGFQMPPRGPQQASGSGVILSSDGYIITNNHVINGASEIEVVLYDKRSYKADVIGTDPNTDIALIKVNAEGLSPIKIGNSDAVRVGEWVLAVGNPFNLTSTVTAGIVSAKGRNIRLLGGGTAIESFIQTDAAVNPGNSGGALINSKGELVGINTAIATQTGQYAGYSFAVPVNIMKKVVEDFREFGEVQRGFLGVQIQDMTSQLAKEKGMDRPIGVLVDQLTDNGAASDAGMKKGDVITKVDGRIVNSVAELQEIIGLYRPGQEVKTTVIRNKGEKELNVVLRNKDGKTGMVTSTTKELQKSIGASFENLKDSEKDRLEIKNGVKISAIDKGYFRNAEVPVGYIITKVDKVSVYSVSDVYKALEGKKGGILIEGFLPNGNKKYYVLELGNK